MWSTTRGQLAQKSRYLPPDDPELARLRSKLRGERLHDLVAKKLALDPRPTDEQLTALVELISAHMSNAG